MARHKAIPKKQLDAMLKAKRKVSPATRARINEITEHAVKRDSLLAQAAILEEIIETNRKGVIKGIASAQLIVLKAQKQLAELLQNRAPDRMPNAGKPGLAGAPRWIPEAKPAKKPEGEGDAAPELDDAELNEQLAADVAAHAAKN